MEILDYNFKISIIIMLRILMEKVDKIKKKMWYKQRDRTSKKKVKYNARN